jgi:hypothetical protein
MPLLIDDGKHIRIVSEVFFLWTKEIIDQTLKPEKCLNDDATSNKRWCKMINKQNVSHTDTTMCGSLNFQELHQGYLSVVRLLRAFGNFIGNDECAW